MKSKKEEILRLRAEGKTYKEIMKITGVSKSTVCYNCGENQKEKMMLRQAKRRGLIHPYQNKIKTFHSKKLCLTLKAIGKRPSAVKINIKITEFHKNRKTKEYHAVTFTFKDVLAKFGENPKCYLTGDYIDIYDPSTYQFDHIMPVSKGGTNTLDNLGICTKEANMSKTNHTLDEFYLLCEKVLKVRDSKNKVRSEM